MSKQNTRATIDANIKQNGQQLITGQILNSVLNAMVNDYAEQAETTEKLTDLERKVGDTNTALGGLTDVSVVDLPNTVVTSAMGILSLNGIVKGARYKFRWSNNSQSGGKISLSVSDSADVSKTQVFRDYPITTESGELSFVSPDDGSYWRVWSQYSCNMEIDYIKPSSNEISAIKAEMSGLNSKVGEYIDNPEWIRLITDAEKRILVGITPNGELAGSAVEKAVSRAKLYAMPEDYGALGDGVSDDTYALKKCIEENDYIVFSGMYRITSSVEISSSKVLLSKSQIERGYGPWLKPHCGIKTNGLINAVVLNSGASLSAIGLSIIGDPSRFTDITNISSISSIDSAAIYSKTGSQIVMLGECVFSGYTYGVRSYAAIMRLMQNCVISCCRFGFHSVYTSDMTITGGTINTCCPNLNPQIQDSNAASTSAGIYIEGTAMLKICNVRLEWNFINLSINGYVNHCIFSDIQSDRGTYAHILLNPHKIWAQDRTTCASGVIFSNWNFIRSTNPNAKGTIVLTNVAPGGAGNACPDAKYIFSDCTFEDEASYETSIAVLYFNSINDSVRFAFNSCCLNYSLSEHLFNPNVASNGIVKVVADNCDFGSLDITSPSSKIVFVNKNIWNA